MGNNAVLNELNTFLRGTYMGIRAFEHYIQKVSQPDLKRQLQEMQQVQKQNAQNIAERIQNLGGVPDDDEGITGSVVSFMHKLKTSDHERRIIEDAVEGLDKYGVHYSKELIKGDLDPQSQQLVDEAIQDNQRHSEQLRQLLP